jgi:hypothetical protein
MTLDDDATDLLDRHVSHVDDAPGRQLRTGWVLGGALALVAVLAGVGIAAVVSPGPSGTPGASSAAASSTPGAATPISSARGVGTTPAQGPVVAQAGLQRAGHPAGLLTVGIAKPVLGLAPPLLNFNTCGAGDGKQLEYLPVEIREAVTGLAATVTVQPGPTTPPGIGRLGFFFESHDGNALPCRDGAAWPMTDSFETITGAPLVTGYVVLDHAVTAATPQGRPDILGSLQLEVSNLRQFDDYVPRPLTVGTPTVGRLCSGDQDAVCAPLG